MLRSPMSVFARTRLAARARRALLAAATVVSMVAGTLAWVPAPAASAAAVRGLTPGTKLYVPPADAGALAQEAALQAEGQPGEAALIADMTAVPQAVWLTGGTPGQVEAQVQTTMAAAALQGAVPVFVAYDIPGRDCGGLSAGGAADMSAYQAWINAVAAGIGSGRAVVLLEPDALGLLPSSCNPTNYPFTDHDRYLELSHAVLTLEKDPGVGVYLDGTQSAWLAVGQIAQRLVTAGLFAAQGFFLNVSNYQPDNELVDYGTWISDCIAYANTLSQPSTYGKYSNCASQYYPATESDFSTWGLTTAWYKANMGKAVATTKFIIDSSRNGNGVDLMTNFGTAPFNQSAATVQVLAAGAWCNPPNAGVGMRPTTTTGVPLLAAYLWVKTPGESDGTCDSAAGVRVWDYATYTKPGWPTTAAAQATFDPLWGVDDTAAGLWFPAGALGLAENANPPFASSASDPLHGWPRPHRGRCAAGYRCRPHSVLSVPAQRPALGSSPARTARVQGWQPMDR